MFNHENKNRRGWIRIVEAFVAILLIAGIVLIVVAQDQNKREDVSLRTYISLVSVLREVQLNNTLRGDIITTEGTVEWDSGNFPINVKNKIIEKTPSYLECTGKICSTSDPCLLANAPDKTVYAESAIISSTLQSYNPRQLKLFCWGK